MQEWPFMIYIYLTRCTVRRECTIIGCPQTVGYQHTFFHTTEKEWLCQNKQQRVGKLTQCPCPNFSILHPSFPRFVWDSQTYRWRALNRAMPNVFRWIFLFRRRPKATVGRRSNGQIVHICLSMSWYGH